MSDLSAERRPAPVVYLPWVVPGVTTSDAAETDAASDSGRVGPQARPAWARRSSTAGHLDGRSDDASMEPDDGEASETRGRERDERVDRLVVGRLRRASLSVAEVRGVLIEHGLDDDEVEAWLDRYHRLGYLDDARLAEQVVHVQSTRRGRGSGAILSELGRRGIQPSVARAAIEALDDDAERDQAGEVARRRARQLGGLDRPTAERRLIAFLQRRGYPLDLARSVSAEALTDQAPPDRS